MFDIEARHAKATMGAMPNKTDRNDARGIAQIMRTGWFRAVHVKSRSCRSWRALLDGTAGATSQASRCRERRPSAAARSRAEGWRPKPKELCGAGTGSQ